MLRNAVAWFADRGVTVQRVLSDNGGCYKSYLWRDTCADLGITAKKTRPYRPQTNGKIDRLRPPPRRLRPPGLRVRRYAGPHPDRHRVLPDQRP